MKTTRNSLFLAVAAVAVAGVSFTGARAVADHHEKSEMQSNKDIVATAKGAGQFGTLVKALTAAELAETLQGEGPYTVLAPTDAAFQKLPSGTLDTLLKPANQENLQQILLYHVADGELMAADVTQTDEIETLNGETITVESMGGNVMLNGTAKVVKTDVKASNGVIHAIDGVLIPTGGAEAGGEIEEDANEGFDDGM